MVCGFVFTDHDPVWGVNAGIVALGVNLVVALAVSYVGPQGGGRWRRTCWPAIRSVATGDAGVRRLGRGGCAETERASGALGVGARPSPRQRAATPPGDGARQRRRMPAGAWPHRPGMWSADRPRGSIRPAIRSAVAPTRGRRPSAVVYNGWRTAASACLNDRIDPKRGRARMSGVIARCARVARPAVALFLFLLAQAVLVEGGTLSAAVALAATAAAGSALAVCATLASRAVPRAAHPGAYRDPRPGTAYRLPAAARSRRLRAAQAPSARPSRPDGRVGAPSQRSAPPGSSRRHARHSRAPTCHP